MLNRLTLHPDILGAGASTLCLIHCAATPFLFVAKVCSVSCCAAAPLWWQAVDYLFIAISFAAIYFTTRNSTVKWLRIALWSSWAVLVLAILSESLHLDFLPELFVYIPALAIVGLHLYHLKYCRCTTDGCCTT